MVVVAGLIGFAASMAVATVGGGSLLVLLATTVAPPFALLGLTPVLFPADTRTARESLDRAAAAARQASPARSRRGRTHAQGLSAAVHGGGAAT